MRLAKACRLSSVPWYDEDRCVVVTMWSASSCRVVLHEAVQAYCLEALISAFLITRVALQSAVLMLTLLQPGAQYVMAKKRLGILQLSQGYASLASFTQAGFTEQHDLTPY